MKLGKFLKVWKGPFIVGGDFQTEPAAVEAMKGRLRFKKLRLLYYRVSPFVK